LQVIIDVLPEVTGSGTRQAGAAGQEAAAEALVVEEAQRRKNALKQDVVDIFNAIPI
jgi:hypothetical protein